MPTSSCTTPRPPPERMIFRDELEALAGKHAELDAAPSGTPTPTASSSSPTSTTCLPGLARARDLGLRPGADARRGRGALGAGRPRGPAAPRALLARSSAATAARAAPSPSRTPARRSRSTAPPPCSRPARRPASGCPYGCRMGICHTCTVTKISGTVRDLRNGDEFDQPNEQVQTCVTVPGRPLHPEHLTRRRKTRWPSPTSRSTPTSPTRRSSSSGASSTRSAPRSRSPAAPPTRRTSTG